MRDFLSDFITGSIKRRILANLLNDSNILELDDDTINFIWYLYSLDNETIQKLLETEKEQFIKEV